MVNFLVKQKWAKKLDLEIQAENLLGSVQV